jgi:hypothetical protein
MKRNYRRLLDKTIIVNRQKHSPEFTKQIKKLMQKWIKEDQ